MTNASKIFVYMDEYPENCIHTMSQFMEALRNKQKIIHTTYTGALSLEHLEKGYQLFFVYKNIENECKLNGNDWTSKDIRIAHNIEKIIRAMIYSDIQYDHENCNIPSILQVDSSGYDGGTQPIDILKSEVQEIMKNQLKTQLITTQK